MWQFIQNLFNLIVFQPELNLLYAFFQLTGDIGISIILLAVVVNLIVLPLFAQNYISLQKTRILQPEIKKIQAKHKDDPSKMLAELRAFNQKHGIRNGYIFLVLLFQLFFLSGLYFVIQAVVQGQEVSGLYEIIWGQGNTVANFKADDGSLLAFGFMDVTAPANDYLWVPVISLILSFLYGMYTFRWAPKPALPTTKKDEKKKEEPKSAFDPEAMQKSMEFQALYVMPIFLFVIQYTLPTGLNIYFATTSAFSLIRQIFLTTYYSSHTTKLIKDIVDSDPSLKDDNPYNNLEITGEPDQLASDAAIPALVTSENSVIIEKKGKKNKKTAKKSTKKKAKKLK